MTISDYKNSVKVSTTENIDLRFPGDTFDGVTLTSRARVLVKDQTLAEQNGIYQWRGDSTRMVRVVDTDQNAEVTSGLIVLVEEGDTNGEKQFVLRTPDPISLTVTPLLFEELAPGGASEIVSFTISPQILDVIAVDVQASAAEPRALTVWATEDLVSLEPSPNLGSLSVTGGLSLSSLDFVTDSAGTLSLDVSCATTATLYLVVSLGSVIYVSEELDFVSAPVVSTIDPVSYGTYYNGDDVSGNFTCAVVSTAVAIPGIFFYTENLINGGGVGIRVQTDTGDIDFRNDQVPSEWFSWDDSFAVLKSNALQGRRVVGAVPIDSSDAPIGSPTSLDFQFYDVAPGTAGIDAGDTYDLIIPFATTSAEVPPSVQLLDCGDNDYIQYYDPNGPAAGSNPGSATFLQWDANGIRVNDIQLTGMTASSISIATSVGRGWQAYGDPIPTV